MTGILEVLNLSQNYGYKRVLKEVGFLLPQSEIICLYGANGSGKTTLLKVLAGLQTPKSGKLHWLKQAHSINLFFPDSGLYEDLTTEENLQFFCTLYGSSEIEYEAVWNHFGLDKLSGERVRFLSRGQRAMVALSRTFLKEADLYLLDEPFTGLDDQAKDTLLKYFQIVKGNGKTVLITAHGAIDLNGMVKRWLSLKEGRITEHA